MTELKPAPPRVNNFLYLNRENRWLGFHHQGLEILNDGALQLSSLPLMSGDESQMLRSRSFDPNGPAGIVCGADGTIYISDPRPEGDEVTEGLGHWLLSIDCSGNTRPVPCVGARGSAPPQFDTPRGLYISQHRSSLFVADSRNHRVQILNLQSGQLVEIWGPMDPGGKPLPGFGPGVFDKPVSITGDHLGNIYVVDYARVQKFNRAGDLVEDFWNTLSGELNLRKPNGIASYSSGEKVRLYVVDEEGPAIFVIDGEGRPIRDSNNHPISFGKELKQPLGIAVGKSAIYVGDNELHRIVVYRTSADHAYVGEAVGYDGSVAALALDKEENLLVHSGDSVQPILLSPRGHQKKGVLWSDAISISRKVAWHRLQTVTEALPREAHLRVFFHTSDDATDQPLVDPNAVEPFADSRWKPSTTTPDPFLNTRDVFLGDVPQRYLWLGVLFSGDGRTTPVVPQLKAEFDHSPYLSYLPALYQTNPKSRDFLNRFLSLTETLFQDLENTIGGLSRLFDPQAVPQKFLPWLATWLALEFNESLTEVEQRQLIASAFERYGRRGTVAGLRESLRLSAGVSGIIQEPILNAGWWSLPAPSTACKCEAAGKPQATGWQCAENSVLGMTTMLAASQPQGAVLGSTAALDYSNLITNEQFGAPLFEAVAHQFTVQLYQSELHCADTVGLVKSVLDHEKPAHTDYHLCVIQPRLRVGFQARLGIDAVVADTSREGSLGMETMNGNYLLGGEPTGTIGENRVGIASKIG